jgi:hypothetical protein
VRGHTKFYLFKVKMAPTKSVHMVESQQVHLLDFMISHPLFARGKFFALNGREKNNAMWDTLARQLNSHGGGCTKEVSKWKEVGVIAHMI